MFKIQYFLNISGSYQLVFKICFIILWNFRKDKINGITKKKKKLIYCVALTLFLSIPMKPSPHKKRLNIALLTSGVGSQIQLVSAVDKIPTTWGFRNEVQSSSFGTNVFSRSINPHIRGLNFVFGLWKRQVPWQNGLIDGCIGWLI